MYGNHGYGIDVNPTQQIPNTEHSPGNVNTGVEGNEVLIMNTKNEDRPTSFFAQPGILAGMLKFSQSFGLKVISLLFYFSCHWWSGCWTFMCYISCYVHRLSDAKKG